MKKIKENLKWKFKKIKIFFEDLRFNFIMNLKEKIYSWEHKKFMGDIYWAARTQRRVRCAILNPVPEILKTIEVITLKRNQENGIYRSYPSYNLIGIFGVDVDTQGETVIVNLKIGKPGMIIGKGGSIINEVQSDLEKKFNIPVKINLIETPEDHNLNFM